MTTPRQALEISFAVVWKTPWHVGSGYRTTNIDRLVRRRRMPAGLPPAEKNSAPQSSLKDAEWPYVPGSQIKGVLRQRVEQLAVSWGGTVQDPHATGLENRELIAAFGPLHRSQALADRLFGSRYQGDCLFVSDALSLEEWPHAPFWDDPAKTNPKKRKKAGKDAKDDSDEPQEEEKAPSYVFRGASGESVETFSQPRVGLDRTTGTSKEGHLYVTERTGAGQVLLGHIRARHPAGVLTQYPDEEIVFPFEYSLLLAALLSLNSLGGDTSAGSGWCDIQLLPGGILWKDGANAPQEVSFKEALTSFETFRGEWWDYMKLGRESQAEESSS
ncbi:MAG: hypothetical protein KDA84_19240 [Planctomycetaceae bacterium]|nr:hypothetical protein [Planctomycetaceae bacterium]